MIQAELKKLLHYNLLTGDFTWKVRTAMRIKIGDIAGWTNTLKGKDYIRITLLGTPYAAHRLAFLYVLGEFPEHEADHINGNGLDNRWINLRPVTRSENCKNVRLPSTNTSGHVGVSWNKKEKKWQAMIRADNKQKSLGLFEDIKDAIKARKAAERKYGYHVNHGQDRPL